MSLRPLRALRPGHILPFLALTLFLNPAPGSAQYDAAPRPAAWGLEGVTVVQPGSDIEENMTIVVRDGLIETLAAGAPIPDGVRVIGWDEGTLWIYPGIVDAHGNAPTSFPTPSREDVESWNPTREVQFFTPHRVTADFLTTDGEGLSAHRRRGVVASAVYPGRGIMPGQPSLILHRRDARAARDLVLRPSIGVAMAFQGAQGAYPGTLMAQHAFIRQTFHDAAHDGVRAAAYRNGSSGIPLTGDADYAVVRQMAAGDVPVLFRADDAGEIRRVLDLSDELGFEPIIVGGQEAGLLAEDLSERGVPVLLSSRMPSPSDWDPDLEDDEEISPAAFREKQRLEPVFQTPAMLAEHGVPFAFTSGGEGAVDMLDGIRKAIEYGLDPDDALRALTTWPAEFLGVPELTRVRQGAAATFVVTDGPIFDEGRSVTWTFVNGQAEKGADPRTPGEAAADDEDDASASDFAGTWDGTVSAAGQEIPMRLELRADGDDLEGEITSGGGDSTALQNVRIEGANLLFDVSVPEMGGARSSYTATVDDDLMRGSGEIATPGGSFSFNFELRRSPAGDNR